eukprot:CAMPEP_0171780608 /NCGR_PEP_ID=MMETSP0991-20121206/59720_1 /TAXON_ID=483369 /ORGANISM="non described non described, Strain CCMP2098" /LENGTH=492 /DNA_ID=CAMNT_0012388029 /DNA_START=42 /DNA_END=1517 /DNA_ORIENTATION=-
MSSHAGRAMIVIAIYCLPIAVNSSSEGPSRPSARASAADAPRRRRRKSSQVGSSPRLSRSTPREGSSRASFEPPQSEAERSQQASDPWYSDNVEQEKSPSSSEQWSSQPSDPWATPPEEQWPRQEVVGDAYANQQQGYEQLQRQHEQNFDNPPVQGYDSNAAAADGAGEAYPALTVVEARRQTTAGKLVVSLSAALCGVGIGSAVNAYVVKNSPRMCMAAAAAVGLVSSLLGGNVGALFRALAVMLLLTLERWRGFSRDYPLLKQLKCVLVRRRNRFPPHAPPNLRRYRATPEHPLEFSMSVCMLSAGILGALLGYILANALAIFILPPSVLALAIAGFLLFSATFESVEGDLVRCTAMKGVGLVRLVAGAATETEVPRKTLGLAGFVGTKIVALDQRFHVKDRVFAAANYLFNQAKASPDDDGPSSGGGSGRSRGGDRSRGRRRRSSQTPAAPEPNYPDVPYDTNMDHSRGRRRRSSQTPSAPEPNYPDVP